MTTATATMTPPAATAAPDLAAVKTRQQAAWSSGDYAVVGTTLQIVGEELCEALDLRSGQKVLDVAAGNGNVTLAAARRWCDVTSTDYVPALLERGRARARAEGWTIEFKEADAEALPFPDGSFDVVVSTFGVMFTPNQDQGRGRNAAGLQVRRQDRARQLDAGRLHRAAVQDDRQAHAAAGRREIAGALGHARAPRPSCSARRPSSIETLPRNFMFRYRSAQHWMDVFKTYYGPLLKTFAALQPPAQQALHDDITALIGRMNRASDGTMVAAERVPGSHRHQAVIDVGSFTQSNRIEGTMP